MPRMRHTMGKGADDLMPGIHECMCWDLCQCEAYYHYGFDEGYKVDNTRCPVHSGDFKEGENNE
jgi:hypothetical protein